jgi:hypothetical protein
MVIFILFYLHVYTFISFIYLFFYMLIGVAARRASENLRPAFAVETRFQPQQKLGGIFLVVSSSEAGMYYISAISWRRPLT